MVRIDEGRLGELITESQDLHSDAMRAVHDKGNRLADIAREVSPAEGEGGRAPRAVFDRRRLLRDGGGMGFGAVAAVGLAGTSFGAALATIVAGPAAAQTAGSKETSIQVFQTASSLENLAVATYAAALTLPFIGDNPVVQTFAETTMQQHQEHGDAFKQQTTMLGGTPQETTNPKYTPVVEQMKPSLTDYAAVVELAATLEQVAQDTYIANLALLPADETRQLMAAVLSVETQHLATLRAVAALLDANAAAFIAIPTDLANLPAAAGSVAFPEPFEEADLASPPAEGAVK